MPAFTPNMPPCNAPMLSMATDAILVVAGVQQIAFSFVF